MIQTEDLSKQFDSFLAVDRVNLQVNSGEVLALLGPNGAGKTTTLRMLTSVLRPTSGWARVAGYDILTQAEGVRASVGILTEQHGLYGRMSAEEYLDFFGQVYRMSAEKRHKRLDELLQQYGLDQERKRKIGEYSKGMRQKLALARALLHDPPVLLMDEPTSAMDPESARLVRDAIHGLRSANRAIIVCTHNLAEAEELADQIAIIHHGKIIITGAVDQLKTYFLGVAQFEVHLGKSYDIHERPLPEGASLTDQGADWFRYQTETPLITNPSVIQALVEREVPVVGLFEVPRSLEKVYLQAISAANGNEHLIAAGEAAVKPGAEAQHAG
ncbi:MAG TPA: ABC transporter ATP-binding protein [Anaerolineales bacterium]